MKHEKTAILKPEQATYLERLLPPRDPVLAEMEEMAARENIPISDPEVGRTLLILARSLGARSILEVGTAIGYGAILLARSAADARVSSIDKDPEMLATARGFIERAGVAEQVELLEGAALEVIPRLEGPYDLIYVDAVKTEYRDYLDLLVPRLRQGGLLVCDNLLWGGKVADPPEDEDESTRALRTFNDYLMMHPQLQSVVLSVGDGLGLATKV